MWYSRFREEPAADLAIDCGPKPIGPMGRTVKGDRQGQQ